MLEEQWDFIIESITREFGTHKSTTDKIKGYLPDGKNLAEL